ncbi:hypothetical protein SAMN02746065_12254 [Desulfocicer vacuolatum DSM 3385]|uniref:Uncharacterized protein n=1 Tax=Desulfocicer vacuolatum DSM 3385 TaxID=1121400 RepID=A0A1W2DYZ5_9BACT|nr:hypothetical protein [Desulfocicer vacuolatum]SMD02673.1 hypothetical protein SAMN02746065_12254 [Desulfocicer vacuolatum DSM 3385]
MIIYDGVYKWDGKQRGGETPVCWWPGEYHIRIIKLNSETPDIHFLKDHAVLCQNMGKGTSIQNYVQNFARLVSIKYDLQMEKTMWVEFLKIPRKEIMVANMDRVADMAGKGLFKPSWRPILPNEKTILSPYFDGFDEK